MPKSIRASAHVPARARRPSSDDAALALDKAPGHLLRRCHRRSREIFEALIGRHGLSRQQFAVLIAMSRQPAANLTEIAATTGFDRNTLAEMIGRLVKKRYVTRRRSAKDARAFTIALSPAGARFVAEMMPRAHEVQRRILAPLPEALRPVFLRCLRILLGLDEPAEEEPAPERRPASASAPDRAPAIDAPEIDRLRMLEESMWRAETRFDRAYMDRTLAPSFFEFGRSGRVYTREQIVGTPEGEIAVRFPLRNFQVTPVGPLVALVTYVSEVEHRDLEIGNRSSLWLKTPDGWQLNFHQGTAVRARHA